MDKLVAIAASTIFGVGLMISACAARSAPFGSVAGRAVVGVAPADAVSLQPQFAATVGDRVSFEPDRFTLTREARARLARQRAWLSSRGPFAVVIAGHCDSREARNGGVDLAARRTDAVFDYLSA